jgi:hypothetical protein
MIVCNSCGTIHKTFAQLMSCACSRTASMPLADEADEYGWREVDWQEALNPDEGDKG